MTFAGGSNGKLSLRKSTLMVIRPLTNMTKAAQTRKLEKRASMDSTCTDITEQSTFLDFPSSPKGTSNVRFSSMDEVRTMPRLKRSKAEKSKLWYSKPELEVLKQEYKELAMDFQIAKACGKGGPSQLEVRGLEKILSREASLEFKARYKALTKSVLEEQQLQREMKTIDTSRLRRASARFSKPAKKEALVLGHSDSLDSTARPTKTRRDEDKSPNKPSRQVSKRVSVDRSPLRPNRVFSFQKNGTRKPSIDLSEDQQHYQCIAV